MMKPKMPSALKIATIIGAAANLAACSSADNLPSRKSVLDLMNRNAPFNSFQTLYICDVSSFPEGVLPRKVDWHFAPAATVGAMRHCKAGDVSQFGEHDNFGSNTVATLVNRERLATIQKWLGPIDVTTSFDGFEHHYVYHSGAPLELGKDSGGFAGVEPADPPFYKLTLRSFRYRIGEITGVREPGLIAAEMECGAIAEYRFETFDHSPWAELWKSASETHWNSTHAACLVKYDDGWRVKSWSVGG